MEAQEPLPAYALAFFDEIIAATVNGLDGHPGFYSKPTRYTALILLGIASEVRMPGLGLGVLGACIAQTPTDRVDSILDGIVARINTEVP